MDLLIFNYFHITAAVSHFSKFQPVLSTPHLHLLYIHL
jgi:hypothetical protein